MTTTITATQVTSGFQQVEVIEDSNSALQFEEIENEVVTSIKILNLYL